MSQRSEELAGQFEQAVAQALQLIEPMSDAQWAAKTPEEGWSVGVTAHHAAGSLEGVTHFMQLAAAGEALPSMTMEQLNDGNAQHAQQFADVTKPETVELLKANGQKAAAVVRSLTDAQLQNRAALPIGDLNLEQLVQGGLIGHLQQHFASIKAAG